jgi:MoaA/NifB/PqqE/SkfB family radical SAM enzyme
MHFQIDDEFLRHFQNLKQVFLYVTNECNLRCAHCLYKPNLVFHLKEKEIELETVLALLSDFRQMGACKLTIEGGEPTLYGASKGHKPLFAIINEAKKLKYEYVRISTNGTFDSSLLLKTEFAELDELSFSLEGFNPKINDALRGEGVFNKCVSNIKKAVTLGYNVNITCCLHKKMFKRDSAGNLLLHNMIKFAESLGVKRINFHDLFKFGVPMDSWTGTFDAPMNIWQSTFDEIQKNVSLGRYYIQVRLPQCFVGREEFERNPEYYGYCPAKMGERVLVHPNGIIRICSNMIGTPFDVAKYYDRMIIWNKSPTNELKDHKLRALTPCTNRSKCKLPNNLVPLCFSFKPMQEEIVWKDKLAWDSKRKEEVVTINT